MSREKLSLNTDWLTGCGGCHVNLVDLHEKILNVLQAVDIQRCPLLTDEKGYPKADIGIITGAVANEHNRHAAKQMRDACEVLIAFGTCAVYGGIPGAALAHTREELLHYVFQECPTTERGVTPERLVPPLEKMVTPVDEVVDIDFYLPGCPPHAAFTLESLLSLIEKRKTEPVQETVCGHCHRTMKKTDVAEVRPLTEGIPDGDLCFLSQGYVCLGSVTLDRCLSPCPKHGIPCSGCAGPTMTICTEPNRDIRTEVAERMSRLTNIDRSTIVSAIEQSAKTHYAYAMATRMIGQKPTFLIKNWIAKVEAKS